LVQYSTDEILFCAGAPSFVRQCGELLAHIQNTNTQYNLPQFCKKITRKYNRAGVAGRFCDPAVKASVGADLKMIDAYHQIIF
jgi:hypothetical protein